MLLLIIEGIQLNYGANLFFCGSKAWGSFYLFDARSIACKLSMLFRFLQVFMQFMIFFSSGYAFFFPINNPRTQKL
jgi:hypothetical protein